VDALELSNEEMILAFLAEGEDDFVSGTALSDKLGLSRAAIWKHVEQLRHRGYRIEAQASRGYRLVEIPDRVTTLELAPLLATRDLGRTVHFFEKLGSTNATAFQLAIDGAPHGDVVIAEEQLEGRGRRGRIWNSPPGENLYLSIILRPDVAPPRAPEMTLVAAVALAETLRDSGVEAQIKWPNDVQVAERKVAGILTELSADIERVHFLILGVGVNLNVDPSSFPKEVAAIATSVKFERNEHVPRALFAAAFLTRLEAWVDEWTEFGFAPIRERWKALSSTIGREVLIRNETRELRGVAEDIDEGGALLLKVGDESVRVFAGDVEYARVRKL
jgi:BirA family biotin operon repressor/biotin-[acetyl-CoA-carboxylase] ligase